MSWKQSADEIRQTLRDAIPAKWTLSPNHTAGLTDVTAVPATCGLLSADDLAITEQTATQLVAKLAAGQLSSVRVTEAFCARAAIAHQLVNCLTVFFPDKALARARELDDHLQRTGTPIGPLHGLPIAVKDTHDVPGHATTWGYAARAPHRATRPSATVATLLESGAVLFAKTTMPQGGMMLETFSNLYGRTVSPFDPSFGAGGSSGGDGALVALRGCSVAPSTDIGGSIRAPTAFNGLYGIRPSADRVPKRGMMSVETGQQNIRVSVGPVAHSVDDLRLMTGVLLSSGERRYDPSCVPMPWDHSVEGGMPEKLAFGVWETDGVVTPHPPIQRAIRETVARLERAGHQVIKFDMPIDCWEASQVYYDIYYQCGNGDCTALLAQAGESTPGPMNKMYEIYNTPEGPIDARRLLTLLQTQNRYRNALSDAWDATADQTTTGRPIDGLICPVSPVAGYPHEFLPWWGYTSLFNLVDYPSTVVPVKTLRINSVDDAKDPAYKPLDNPFDAENHAIYNPELWSNMPVALQLVARPFDDERLMGATAALDAVINA